MSLKLIPRTFTHYRLKKKELENEKMKAENEKLELKIEKLKLEIELKKKMKKGISN
jgi:cell division protein FtsB